jgi:hypothetical protein
MADDDVPFVLAGTVEYWDPVARVLDVGDLACRAGAKPGRRSLAPERAVIDWDRSQMSTTPRSPGSRYVTLSAPRQDVCGAPFARSRCRFGARSRKGGVVISL